MNVEDDSENTLLSDMPQEETVENSLEDGIVPQKLHWRQGFAEKNWFKTNIIFITKRSSSLDLLFSLSFELGRSFVGVRSANGFH